MQPKNNLISHNIRFGQTGLVFDRLRKPTDNITALLDAIIEYIPEPQYLEGTPQMLITSLDYSPFMGRIAVGRVHRGEPERGYGRGLV